MGKCLVTKLKSVVDNDSLIQMGSLKIHVECTSESTNIFAIGIKTGSTVILKAPVGVKLAVSEAKLQEGTNILNVPFQTSIFGSKGEYDIEITNKYDITYLTTSNLRLNIDDLKFSEGMTWLTCGTNVSGDIASFKNMKDLSYASIGNGSKVVGDVSVFNNLTLLKSLYINSSEEAPINIYGHLNVNNLTNLVNLQVNGANIEPVNISSIKSSNIGSVYGNRLFGNIKEFVSVQKGLGRSNADDITVNINNSADITFGTIKPQPGNYKLSWDDNNIILKSNSTKIAYINGPLNSLEGYTVTKVD